MAKKASTNQILIQKIEILEGANEVKIKLTKFNPFYKLAKEYKQVERLHSEVEIDKKDLSKFFKALDQSKNNLDKAISSLKLDMNFYERPEFIYVLENLNNLDIDWYVQEVPRKKGESDADYFRDYIMEYLFDMKDEIDDYIGNEADGSHYKELESGYIYQDKRLNEDQIYGIKYSGHHHRDGSFYGNYLLSIYFEGIESYYRFIVDGKTLSKKEFLKLKDKT